jgi:hypothetical protein
MLLFSPRSLIVPRMVPRPRGLATPIYNARGLNRAAGGRATWYAWRASCSLSLARPRSLARRAACAGWRKELGSFSNPTMAKCDNKFRPG